MSFLLGHRVLNENVTVRTKGVGVPFKTSGVYRHCLSAAIAALSSSGRERSTLADSTQPSVPTTASRITVPTTCAAAAMFG